MVRISYDSESDILYIEISDKQEYDVLEAEDAEILVDEDGKTHSNRNMECKQKRTQRNPTQKISNIPHLTQQKKLSLSSLFFPSFFWKLFLWLVVTLFHVFGTLYHINMDIRQRASVLESVSSYFVFKFLEKMTINVETYIG